MEMPVPLKAVRALSWLHIGAAAFALIVLLLSGVFRATPRSVLYSTRNGIVRLLHVQPPAPADATTEIAPGDGRGAIAATKIFLLAALPILLLRFIRRRNLTGMKVVAGVEVLAGIGNGGIILIPLAMFITMFLKSTGKYIRQEEDGEIPIPRVIRSSQWEG
jgi:hypothetical protein